MMALYRAAVPIVSVRTACLLSSFWCQYTILFPLQFVICCCCCLANQLFFPFSAETHWKLLTERWQRKAAKLWCGEESVWACAVYEQVQVCVCLSSLIKVPTDSFFFYLAEGLLVCLSASVSNLTVNKPFALSDLPQKVSSFTFFLLHLILLFGNRINIGANFKTVFTGIHAVTCKALKTCSAVFPNLPWACKLPLTPTTCYISLHLWPFPIALL